MINFFRNCLSIIIALIFIIGVQSVQAQIVDVGDGSYTTQFPGTDEAGRNTYPSGSPFVVGNAVGKPVPTNDWWSSKIKNNHSDNLFNYPFTLKTTNAGLVATYIPWGVIDDISPVVISVDGLNANAANVSDYSDWTVSMEWKNLDHKFTATTGIGMPFIYFTKNDNDIAKITVNSGSVQISEEQLIITDLRNDADFVVYAPEGSVWEKNSNVYTSNLNGKNYWSLAFIPLDATSITDVVEEYKEYAFVFPTNTTANWNYDNNTSVLRTDFIVDVDVKEGSGSTILMGLLPHQWSNLAMDSPIPDKYSYSTVRGELKTLASNTFSVENTFHGILPTLPYLDNYSDGFSPQKLNEKVELLENDGLSTWTDSYNEGQMMNRLIQTARIADLMGNNTATDKILETIKERLEDWLSANTNEVAFIFYYNDTWTSMIGYPAGHGQDGNLNDHHFHWGYFIHAAAFVEQFEPGWTDKFGGMIDLLIRDAASQNREDDMFPFLRNFSPYAGHCWANGFATFPQGNDQESTSESMQFNSSLIHWGSITGNDEIRDLGIYLYTTEQSAVEEYWFDMYERIFGPSQQYSLVSRVWGNSYDNGTFWTNDIAASYGIEMYPIHGGSMYLGHNINYVNKLWNEIEQNTGILNNEVNDNLWHDIMYQYLAFTDPQKAIDLYNSNPDRSLKFGVSDAQTYHWLHSMNVLGNVNSSITANIPMATAFNSEDEIIYTAHNYKNEAVSVMFSDGYILDVAARSMATSKDISLNGVISSSFNQAFSGGSVELSVLVSGGEASKLELFDGESYLGEITQPPYVFKAENLFPGKHSFFAKVYDGENFSVSNMIGVIVGEQLPYQGSPIEIPGSFYAGYYDKFEGGIGQGVSYSDVSPDNAGDFRTNEYVDAVLDFNEGATIGWISSGEWLEYTVEVAEAGYHSIEFRYASGNSAGGGPFVIMQDDQLLSPEISVNYTGDWDSWATKTVGGIPLKSGKQVLRIYFNSGEFNLGNISFSYESPLPYDQPKADAGENILVELPESTVQLDGSNSTDPGGAQLIYNWTQVYGPTTLDLSNGNIAKPLITGLEEGVYLMKLTVSNGTYSDDDNVYVISSNDANIPPTVSIISPSDNQIFIEQDIVEISANASDLVGYVEKVEFFVNDELIGSINEEPYIMNWNSVIGEHILTAVAHDNYGSSTISQEISILVNEAPSCSGISSNGEFEYEFSPDDNNPTITFIPTLSGMGNPTCILYYGTNQNNMPGYHVTPDVPFQISASQGNRIYFYYTYSYPGQGEHNNSANKDTYVIGSCKPSAITDFYDDLQLNYYPNPVSNSLFMELPNGDNSITIYDMTGNMLADFVSNTKNLKYDMTSLKSGIYIFKVMNGNRLKVFKVIK